MWDALAGVDVSVGGSTPQADTPDAKRRRTHASACASDGGAAADACSHPTYWAGMCVVCGEAKPSEDGAGVDGGGGGWGGSTRGSGGGGGHRSQQQQRRYQPPSYHAHGGAGGAEAGGAGASGVGVTHIRHMHARAHLELTGQEADRLRKAEERRLLSARKLVLVLDLVRIVVCTHLCDWGKTAACA